MRGVAMFVKKGVQNARRYYKISTFLLLFFLSMTIIVSSSLQVRHSLTSFLDQCDKTYTTVGIFEYLGTNYPNDHIYDPTIKTNYINLQSILNENSNTYKTFNPYGTLLGQIDGLERKDKNVFCGTDCIAEIYVMSDKLDQSGAYNCIITNDFYSKEGYDKNFCYIDSQGAILKKGHSYLIHGNFYLGHSSYPYLAISPVKLKLAEKYGLPHTQEDVIVDLTDLDKKQIEQAYEQFQQLADTYNVVKNSVKIIGTTKLESLLAYQSKAIYIAKGDTFTEQNYKNQDKVCIISQEVAKRLELGVNDTIKLSKTHPSEYALEDSFWITNGFASTEDYTIVGIFDGDFNNHYDVYVPETPEGMKDYGHYTYTLGQAIFKNDTASENIVQLSKALPSNIRMTTYDGGYTILSRPITEMLTTVNIIYILACITCATFLILFGYLLVYKQKVMVQVLMNLGTGKKNIITTFISSASTITLISGIPGSIIGFLCTKNIIARVLRKLDGIQTSQNRFSNTSLAPITKITFTSKITYSFFFLVMLGLCLFTIFSCIAFVFICLKPKMKKVSVQQRKTSNRSTSLSGGATKYAFLSLKRGGIRSCLPFLITFASIFLILQLQGTLYNYKSQLNSLESEFICSGHITNIYGNDTFKIIANSADYNNIKGIDGIDEIHVQTTFKYLYENNTPQYSRQKDIKLLPQNAFALATYINHMLEGSDLVFTDNIADSQEFYFNTAPDITYMDGMDDEKFYHPQVIAHLVLPCIATNKFKEEHQLSFGDDFLIFCNPSNPKPIYLKLVGTYKQSDDYNNLYVPMEYYHSIALNEASRKYDSMIFTLKNPKYLDTVKKALDDFGYSPAHELGKLRKYIVIEDANYYSIKNGLEQKIRYMQVLFPILCCLLEFIALTISFVLIKARGHELTTLRLLGASKSRCFFNLYLEQFWTTLVALGLGLGFYGLIQKVFVLIGVLLSCLFFFLWNLGTLLSLIKYVRKPVIYIQKDVI